MNILHSLHMACTFSLQLPHFFVFFAYWKDNWQHFCCSSAPSHWQLIFVRSSRKGLPDPLLVLTTIHLCRAYIHRACNKRVSSSWRLDGDSLLDSQRYWIMLIKCKRGDRHCYIPLDCFLRSFFPEGEAAWVAESSLSFRNSDKRQAGNPSDDVLHSLRQNGQSKEPFSPARESA